MFWVDMNPNRIAKMRARAPIIRVVNIMELMG